MASGHEYLPCDFTYVVLVSYDDNKTAALVGSGQVLVSSVTRNAAPNHNSIIWRHVLPLSKQIVCKESTAI